MGQSDLTRAPDGTHAPPPIQPRCRTCDYVLSGLAENRCPECGRPFDPNDPRTMNIGRTPGPIAKKLLALPSTSTIVISVFVGAITLVACSAPGGYFHLLVLVFVAWMLLLCAWLARWTITSFLAHYYRRTVFKEPGAWRAHAIVPVVFAATLTITISGFPARLTFWFSRPSLNTLATQFTSAGKISGAPTWIGLFPVDPVQRVAGGFRFIVRGSGFMDRYGFAYLPNGPPGDQPQDVYSLYSGPWYIWFDRL